MKQPERFQVIITQGGGGYFTAKVPALPGCYTQAKTLPELRKRIREATQLCLEVCKIDASYRKQVRKISRPAFFVALDMVEV